MVAKEITELTHKAAQAKTIRLFLDYDGTLAEFAPSPDMILPDQEVIALLERFVAMNGVLLAVISGRRLTHIQKLLPIRGLLLGGTYGIEMQLPNGELRTLLSFEQIRPTLEQLLPRWQGLIAGRKGFYLEDKGWSLALHGRFATDEEAETVIATARIQAQELHATANFKLLGGNRFLEFAPHAASKSKAVQWILKEMTPEDSLNIYIGDDDKDEEAFSTLLDAGGYAIRVAAAPTATRAQFRLEGPPQVRAWLAELLTVRSRA